MSERALKDILEQLETIITGMSVPAARQMDMKEHFGNLTQDFHAQFSLAENSMALLFALQMFKDMDNSLTDVINKLHCELELLRGAVYEHAADLREESNGFTKLHLTERILDKVEALESEITSLRDLREKDFLHKARYGGASSLRQAKKSFDDLLYIEAFLDKLTLLKSGLATVRDVMSGGNDGQYNEKCCVAENSL